MGELVEDNGLGREVAAEGFKGPGLDPSHKGEDKEYLVLHFLLRKEWVWFGLAGNWYPQEADGVNLV
jgi:hypothetical protein